MLVSTIAIVGSFVVARIGLLQLYPHPLVLDLFVVGIGFLMGWLFAFFGEIGGEKLRIPNLLHRRWKRPVQEAKGLFHPGSAVANAPPQ